MTPLRLALVGLPGSGKSTVGRQLARRLSMDFVDSDASIEARLGCSIREFFEREGEAAFRDQEAVILQELVESPRSLVIATGGGAVLRPENRERLRANAHVVYLRSRPDELIWRLRHDTTRPLLQVADPLGRLKELHDQRDPLYCAAAHDVIETGRPSVSRLVNLVMSQLTLAGLGQGAD